MTHCRHSGVTARATGWAGTLSLVALLLAPAPAAAGGLELSVTVLRHTAAAGNSNPVRILLLATKNGKPVTNLAESFVVPPAGWFFDTPLVASGGGGLQFVNLQNRDDGLYYLEVNSIAPWGSGTYASMLQIGPPAKGNGSVLVTVVIP